MSMFDEHIVSRGQSEDYLFSLTIGHALFKQCSGPLEPRMVLSIF
jgi:hypothetical protein